MENLQNFAQLADQFCMTRHLHLVPSGPDLDSDVEESTAAPQETNVVDLESERLRRRYRYHPSAGRAWIDDLFDDDDFDPVS